MIHDLPLKPLVVDMLKENTGTHFLDSGGAYGRNWQRNQGATVEAYEGGPSAKLELWRRSDEDFTDVEFMPTISVYHWLVGSLGLDDVCDAYNVLPCEDWDSEAAYGVSAEQEKWLRKHGFKFGRTVNTYNHESTLSQVLQWTEIYTDDATAEYPNYVLMQIHGGCDVRGGYTDAKLFRIECEHFGLENCGFSIEIPINDDKTVDLFTGEPHRPDYISLEWRGEWIDQEGSPASPETFEAFARLAYGDSDETTVYVDGDACTSY